MSGRVKVDACRIDADGDLLWRWVCEHCGHDDGQADDWPAPDLPSIYASAAEHWRTCPALRLERLLDEIGQLRMNLAHDAKVEGALRAVVMADTGLLRVLTRECR